MTMLKGDFSADPSLGRIAEGNLNNFAAALTDRWGSASSSVAEMTTRITAQNGRRIAAEPPEKVTRKDGYTDDLPEDARLYVRHVEGGETIRAIAREQGCHASTILRRIRRFEERRDEDPLLDRAVSELTDSTLTTARSTAEAESQLRRVLRRLAEPGAVMAVAANMDRAIVTRHDMRTAILDRSMAENLALQGLIVMQTPGRIARYVLTPAGRDRLRAMLRGGAGVAAYPCDLTDAAPVAPEGLHEAAAAFVNPHAEAHRQYEPRTISDPETGIRRRVRVNIAESPMMLMARRREKDGSPFLGPDLVAAGERLREDFELAQMGPRITQDWDRFLTAGADRGGFAPSRRMGGSEAARDRVAAALRELGPGMGDVVLRVCCFLEGIEATEQRLGWSARSGKIVLRLGLIRLERHYREQYGNGARMIG
ncbi:DUF6456 domain-containing protein [Paracoccus pacificus]|uniref:DUF6456 domain-containing protein n=1 Tax=Paracoccus pacificus TaxID=1463598 RepID=A0ABW4R8T5_9RHOB